MNLAFRSIINNFPQSDTDGCIDEDPLPCHLVTEEANKESLVKNESNGTTLANFPFISEK